MNAFIIGRRRQGKSTLALSLCLGSSHDVFIFDPNNQFLSVTAYESPEEMTDAALQMETGFDRRMVGRIVPPAGQIQESFAEMMTSLRSSFSGGYSLLIDEASCIQKPWQLPEDLEWLLRQAPRDGARDSEGRIIDISLIQTAHRFIDVHILCRSLNVADHVFLFQTSYVRDLDAIEEQFGRAVRTRVQRLREHECIHCWSTAGCEYYAVWGTPERWYVRT